MSGITWVLESSVFEQEDRRLRDAALEAGHAVIAWDDEWWSTRRFPDLEGRFVVFHGSLANADRIARELDWSPGAHCATEALHCSAYYSSCRDWLDHPDGVFTTVREFVAAPREVAGSIGSSGRVFVRPDSPLKPFSGRVVELDGLSLAHLDYGFYYDDDTLPIVIAPVLAIGQEWRFVVVGGEVQSGCAYDSPTRTGRSSLGDLPITRAREIARVMDVGVSTFVLDLCEVGGEVRLLELNPFSGADLYDCDPRPIVRAIEALASGGE